MDFLIIASLHFFAVSSPGPDFIIVARQCVLYDRNTAIKTSFGISIGVLVHCIFSATGMSNLIREMDIQAIFKMKLLAIIYLGYLGMMSLFLKRDNTPKIDANNQGTFKKAYILGFMTNVLNPKAFLFFTILFTMTIGQNTTNITLGWYSLYMSFSTFLWFTLLSYALTTPLVAEIYKRNLLNFTRLIGIFIILIAANLFYSIFNN